MGVKDVSLVFDNIPANGFEPGTSVSGQVKFVTDKPIRMKNISLLLQGRARVSFMTHEIHWFKYNRKDGTVLGFGRVFDVNWNAITFQRRLSDSNCFRSEQIFVGFEHKLAEESCLHLGVTEYPFSFQLPHNLPPTFNSKLINCHGEIRYKIKVKWSQSGFLAPSDTYKIELPVVNQESLKYLQSKDPQLLEPRVYQEVRPFSVLFSTTDPVKMVVKLPRSAVVSGETLQVDIEIDNTSKTNIDTIHVRFIQRTAWIGKYWTYKNVMVEDVILQEIHCSGVPAHTNKSWTQPITITAEPTAFIEPCSIIKLFHLIMVEVVPSGLYSRMSMVAPIEVCLDSNEKFSKGQSSVSPSAPSAPDPYEFDYSEPPPPYSAAVFMSKIN